MSKPRTGCCYKCDAIFTPENCSPSTWACGSGLCRPCNKVYNQRRYKTIVDETKARAKNWSEANPERRKEILKKNQDSQSEEYKKKRSKKTVAGHRKKKFGITQEEFDAKIAAQKGLCEICKQLMIGGRHSLYKACQDHNHETGKLRDVLCSRCNMLIGGCSENIKILANAIQYLLKHAEDSSIQIITHD